MDKGTIDLKLRPVKLAFLVEPNDKKALAEAIKINSVLWGGMYNPIIPVFSKSPKVWKKNDPISRYKGKDILKGYLDAFDPDFVVPLGKACNRKIDVEDRTIITKEQIVKDFIKDGSVEYGIGLFEVFQGFYNDELKFVRTHPLEVNFFNFRKNSLFFSSVFGEVFDETKEQIKKGWLDHLGAKEVEIDFANYAGHLKGEELFLRRILQHKIEVRGRGDKCLFFMDADNGYDIIDYWNLRALGWTVIPVAKQSATFDQTKKMAKDFIEENSGISRHNKDHYIRVTVMKSRSVDSKEMENFAASLGVTPDEKAHGSRWVFHNWYPRLWDEWARDKDRASCCELSAGTSDLSFSTKEDRVEVPTIDPEFAERFLGGGSPRYANVMNMKIYSDGDIYAETIPDSGKALTRVLSGIGLDDWRFSKKESVYFVKHKSWKIHVPIPKAEEVFTAWMKDKGYEIKLSPSGRIAKQITRQLGGLWGLGLLANEELIHLLRDMQDSKVNELSSLLKNSEFTKAEALMSQLADMQVGKVINKDAFMARMSKIANSRFHESDAVKTLKRFMEHKMFRLGASIQCPVCIHNSWHAVDQLKYTIQCSNCLDNFDLPAHSSDEVKWAYRTFGPFSLSGGAEGSYSTLLVLRLFSKVFDFPVTPSLSFLTKIKGKEKEIDLGLLVKESKFRSEEDTRAVFVECKSFNSFEKKDIEKMEILSKDFPGSVLVFATLKDSLTSKEKKLLKPLVNKCRKYWKAEQPYNPVLILTKTELFSQISLNYAWENSSNPAHKAIAKRHFYQDKLLYTCDATQQLYLGMKPWQEEISEKFEKIRKRREGKNRLNQTSL